MAMYEKKWWKMNFNTSPVRWEGNLQNILEGNIALFRKEGSFPKYFFNTHNKQWSHCQAWRKNFCSEKGKAGLPKAFQNWCKDRWFECVTLEEPWRYSASITRRDSKCRNVKSAKDSGRGACERRRETTESLECMV